MTKHLGTAPRNIWRLCEGIGYRDPFDLDYVSAAQWQYTLPSVVQTLVRNGLHVVEVRHNSISEITEFAWELYEQKYHRGLWTVVVFAEKTVFGFSDPKDAVLVKLRF